MLKKWWVHEWAALKCAARETSLTAVGAGVVIACLAYGLQWNYLWREHAVERSILIGFGCAVLGILCELLIRLHAAAAKSEPEGRSL